MIRRENKKHFSTQGHGATKIFVFVLYLLPIDFYNLLLAICHRAFYEAGNR